MLHGFCRNAAQWIRWLPFLSAQHRVYRMTLPGMGGTPLPEQDFRWTLPALYHIFLSVLDNLALTRVHWVGESSGAMLGILFAAAYPERVASLILVDTPLRRIRSLREEHNLGHSRTAAAIEQYGVEEWCRRTIDSRLDVRKAEPDLVEWYIAQLAKTPASISIAFKDFADTLDIEPVLKTVTAPALLLCGDRSRVITPEQVEIIRRELPRVEVRMFPGYGHGLHVLAPDECARASLVFWKRVEREATRPPEP